MRGGVLLSYRWWVVVMLWGVCLLNYADRQAIFSVFPLLQAEMGLGDVELAIVGGFFMWIYALALPLAGFVGDRFSRRGLVIGGLVFWSLVTLATALSTRYWHLVIFRALEGFGEAFYFPASMSLIADYHGPQTRSRAMALHQSSVYAGTVLGGTAAGFFGQHYGWRSGFYVFGAAGVVLGIALLGFLREPQRGRADLAPADVGVETSTLRGAIHDVFGLPIVWVLVAVFLGANFVAAIFLTWMPSFLGRKFGMSLSMAGLNATAWIQIASIAGVLAGGWLADRWVRRHHGGRMMTQALGLLAGVPFLFVTGWTLSVPVLVLAMVGFGCFKGVYDANIWAALYDVVPLNRRATAVGAMNAIGWLGGGTAPVAMAAVSQRWGMSACLSATSVVYLFVGGLMALGVRLFLPARSTAVGTPTPPPAAG
ncbi:MAG TPA: MFS transporter [Vicinamibacteria bacterium]|nr:MFS transporter [Vicinamibacteria bacterium]